MKRVLVLGKDGMAGHILVKYLNSLKKYVVIATTNKAKKNNDVFFDANKPDEILKIITEVKPDVIINCIGVLVKASDENKERAKLINSYFPNMLAKQSKEYGFKLIHLSTDCVFSGEKGDYTEKDMPDATNTYGKTKALGEINDNHNLTIRMSIIGPEIKENGTGLMHWFFKQEKEVNGYSNVMWTGITTLQLAKAINQILETNIVGLIHLVPDKKISKYELLKLFSEVFNKKITIKKDIEKKEDKSLVHNKNISIHIPDYKTMLIELKEWMIKNKELYDKKIYSFLKN